MTYRVEFNESARKQFYALPTHIQKRILRWTDLLSENPRRVGSKQLKGHPGLRRVQASKDYVIIYTIRQSELIVLIVNVDHRRDSYRNL